MEGWQEEVWSALCGEMEGDAWTENGKMRKELGRKVRRGEFRKEENEWERTC